MPGQNGLVMSFLAGRRGDNAMPGKEGPPSMDGKDGMDGKPKLDPGLVDASRDMMMAFHAKDEVMLARALQNFIDIHNSADGETEEPDGDEQPEQQEEPDEQQ